MSRPESNMIDVLKTGIYRFCFCLGFATASYTAYAQLRIWVGGSPEPKSGLTEKTDFKDVHIQKGRVRFLKGVQNLGIVPISDPVSVPVSVPVSPSISEQPLAKADPSPSATPEASPTPATAASDTPGATEAMAPAVVYPVYPYPNGASSDSSNQMMRSPAQEEAKLEAPRADSAAGSVSSAGLIPLEKGNGSVSSAVGSHGLMGSSNNSAGLSSQDFSLITLALKGVISDQLATVAGVYCGSGVGSKGCVRESQLTIHTSRFSLNEGLSSDASISITGTNASNMQIHLGLKIQDASGNNQAFVATVKAEAASASTEVRNGHSIRIIEISTPKLQIRTGDALQGVQIKLAYDVFNPAAPVLLPESVLTFSRSGVTLSPNAWSFSSPSLVAASDPAIIADLISYSINIEKSP